MITITPVTPVFRNVRLLASLAALGSALLWAADWPTQGGSPQREGWAKSERVLTKANIAGLKVLYAFAPEPNSQFSLSPPIVNGNLITYKGFKEMLVFSANSRRLFSVDADLNRAIWDARLDAGAPSGGPCSEAWSSPVVMAGSSSPAFHFEPPPGPVPAAGTPPRRRRSPYFPPLAQSLFPLLPTTLTQLNAMYTVSANGSLHVVNSSTGEDLLPPIPFVPANARVTSLNLRDNVVYATTSNGCDAKQNALYALDLMSSDKHVSSYMAPIGGFSGTAGTSMASDGTIFVQAGSAPGDKPGRSHQSLIALSPKDLKVKDYFTPKIKELGKNAVVPGITPLVFPWHGGNMVIAGFSDGRLYLLNAASLGGPSHHTPLFQSQPVATRGKKYDGSGFRGSFASWPDVDAGARWFYAPIAGPADSNILAFKLETNGNGQPELRQVWTSRSLLSPAPPVVANGLLFALSTGNSPRVAKKSGKPYSAAEIKSMAKPAVLYALDTITGAELYSSASTIAAAAEPNGMAVANGRVYFSALDGRVYCLGLPKTQPQLAAQ